MVPALQDATVKGREQRFFEAGAGGCCVQARAAARTVAAVTAIATLFLLTAVIFVVIVEGKLGESDEGCRGPWRM